jgi:hypothetical protein
MEVCRLILLVNIFQTNQINTVFTDILIFTKFSAGSKKIDLNAGSSTKKLNNRRHLK